MAAKTETDTISDNLAGVAHEAIDKVAANAAEAEERIRKAALEAEERVRKSAREVRQRSNDTADTLARFAREHPLASVGVAFAAGYLLAMLFRR